LSGKPCIAVVGGVNIDIEARCRSPFRPRDSNPGSLTLAPGGVGRNIAENLARLGSRVELISVLGDDGFSARLEDSCAAIGIGLGGCLRLADAPTSQYLCILDSDGGLVGAVAAMDSIDRLDPDRLEERASLLDSADLIMVDANIAEDSIAWIARRYPKGHGGPLLAFDPVSAKKASRGAASLGAFSFAKPNCAEAAVLAGLGGSEGEASPPKALAGLLRARGLDEAFISLGEEGLWAEGPGSAPEFPERWRARIPRGRRGSDSGNASGAGDAACAAIAWGLLEGLGLGERCGLAVAAASLASASESPVNPEMSAALLLETAKGIERERLS
jgi:pseudouridine kinase